MASCMDCNMLINPKCLMAKTSLPPMQSITVMDIWPHIICWLENIASYPLLIKKSMVTGLLGGDSVSGTLSSNQNASIIKTSAVHHDTGHSLPLFRWVLIIHTTKLAFECTLWNQNIPFGSWIRMEWKMSNLFRTPCILGDLPRPLGKVVSVQSLTFHFFVIALVLLISLWSKWHSLSFTFFDLEWYC